MQQRHTPQPGEKNERGVFLEVSGGNEKYPHTRDFSPKSRRPPLNLLVPISATTRTPPLPRLPFLSLDAVLAKSIRAVMASRLLRLPSSQDLSGQPWT